MSILTRIKLLYLCHFSKPKTDRPLYAAIARLRASRIVELGISEPGRTLRMLRTARLTSGNVHFVGFDWFETREDSIGIKAAYRILRGSGARVRLLPGDPRETISAWANSLGKVDLLLISAAADPAEQPRMWYFIPRMLHDSTVVFVERPTSTGTVFERLERDAVESLAAAAAMLRRRRAA